MIFVPIVATVGSTVFAIKDPDSIVSKIFHLGMLMYGKEPGMKELWRWMRET